jgi:hypothetical protein
MRPRGALGGLRSYLACVGARRSGDVDDKPRGLARVKTGPLWSTGPLFKRAGRLDFKNSALKPPPLPGSKQ